MTAAEILGNARPPVDDQSIDEAIADLDRKIFQWTDALKSAHAQLRSAHAPKTPSRPSDLLYADVRRDIAAAAAAAHMPTPPPMPSAWTAPPTTPAAEWSAPSPSSGVVATPPPVPGFTATSGAAFAGAPPAGAAPESAFAAPEAAFPAPVDPNEEPSLIVKSWPAPPAAEPAPASGAGVVPWPSAGANPWPEKGASSSAQTLAPQEWPTWTPIDTSKETAAPKKSGMPDKIARTAPKKPAAPIGPTHEERARKAAEEEAVLAQLDEAIARRVRLLRRLDPDTAIEKLIEKAEQGQSEARAAGASPQKSADPKPAPSSSSSSWWRRK